MAAEPIIVFPNGGWSDIPLVQRLWLETLAARHKLYVVTETPPEKASAAEALPLERLRDIRWSESTAILLHPCWVHVAMPLAPSRLVAMLGELEQTEDPLWGKCRNWLSAHATLVIAGSESFYLEQAFRRNGVFLLDGSDETSDLFAIQALEWHVGGYEPDTLVRLQQRYRANWLEHAAQAGETSTEPAQQADQLFLQSVYRYLIGDHAKARKQLLAAFEAAIVEGKENTLQHIYRFLSAIELEQGFIEEAVRTYGYTALSAEERQHAETLCSWLENGHIHAVHALLLQLNDDHRRASALLETKSDDPMMRSMLIETYIITGQLKRAYELISPKQLRTRTERHRFKLLSGTVRLLEGNRHEAIHQFLLAAEQSLEGLGNIMELAVMDQAVREQISGRGGNPAP